MANCSQLATISIMDAVSLHKRGQLDKAGKAYRAVLETDPACHQALNGLGLVMFQLGRGEFAISLIEQAIELRPNEADYHYHLAEVLRELGRGAEAVARYREGICLRPDQSDYHFGLGNALAEQGCLADASAAFRAAVRLAPGDAEIRNNLGNVLAALGDREEAAEQLRRAVSLEPDYAEAHHNLALVLKEQGRLREAVDEARRAHELAPTMAEPLVNLGQVLDASGDTAGAVACYRQAWQLAGNNAALLATIVGGFRQTGRASEALALVERAIESAPPSAQLHVHAARCLMEKSRFEEAEVRARKALDIDQNCAPALEALAACLQSRGDFKASIEPLERALSLQPDLTEAAYMLAATGGYEVPDSELERWRALVETPGLAEDKRIHLEFALAKALDRRGEYEQAFRHYQSANLAKGRRLPFDPARHTEYVGRLMQVFDRRFFEDREKWGMDDDRLVFIVGMPRSGSTLVEQMLGGHSGVAAVGEYGGMLDVVRELPGVVGDGQPFPECMAGLGRDCSEELAQWYLDGLPAGAIGVDRVTDKMLGNLLRLGVIALLFPSARIVHCMRDPVDTCFSCLTQDFARGLRFTTDMQHLVSFYRNYRALMAHWRQVLPLPMFELRYESLVDEPEKIMRELVHFCDLPWEEDCLRPERTRGTIATASLWQARQAVYDSSIRRWKPYEEFIGPLIDALAPYRSRR